MHAKRGSVMRRLYRTAVLSVISVVAFVIVWAVVSITFSQFALFLGI
jgi:hypothetical protein